MMNYQLLFFVFLAQNALNGSLDSSGYVIDVLGLNYSLDVVFEQLCKKVLQLTSTKVQKNLLPIRGGVKKSQVRFELRCQNFECS